MDRQTQKAVTNALNELSHACGPIDDEATKALTAEVERLGKVKRGAKAKN